MAPGASFLCCVIFFFFFNDTATTEIYTLSLHDALPISPSIGLVLFKGAAVTVEDILKQADRAMYKAKEAGRNTMRFYNTASSELGDA